jgi:nucleotide-binding universal stress UspA family protein
MGKMFDEILVCLDGSALAEKILPLARYLSGVKGGTLTLLRVVGDNAELTAEEDYLRDCAHQYSARLSFLVGNDPAAAIASALQRNPRATAALTTHGRTAWAEAILGSVALQVIRQAHRPVILYRPLRDSQDAPKQIDTVVVALDGHEFAERSLPYGVKAARDLSARLVLVQALPTAVVMPQFAAAEQTDLVESSYLHRKAEEIKTQHGITADWEVLHGDPGEAICRYVGDLPQALLVMTSHGRGVLKRAALGSVASACLRHAGVPLMLFWPHSVDE